MKKFLLLILVLASLTSNAQKNEILVLIGKGPYTGDVFQLKCEWALSKKLGLQTGFRYHNHIETDEHIKIVNGTSTTSKFIQSTFTSKKIDLSVVFLPINKNRFKLKTAAGFDLGYSLYTFAHEGITNTVLTSEGYVMKEYWKYEIEHLFDYGIHYILMANYYLKNNLFFSSQVLYNYVFDSEYSVAILRQSTFNFSLGVGYRF